MKYENYTQVEIISGVTYDALGQRMTEEALKEGFRAITRFACDLFGGVSVSTGRRAGRRAGRSLDGGCFHEMTRSYICHIPSATNAESETKLKNSITMLADVVKGALAQSEVCVILSKGKRCVH